MEAKELSATLAKVLSILNKTLTACLCDASEHSAKSGDIRQKATIR